MPGEPSYRKAVISGGTGFIGRRLAVELLARGVEVVVLSRRARQDEPLSGVRYVQCAFDRPEVVALARSEYRGTDVFFHLASDMDWSVEFSERGLSSFRAQVLGPLSFLGVFGGDLAKLVLASSIMVYPLVASRKFQEGRDEAPANFYGAHKLVLETAFSRFADATGACSLSLRIAQVYGPRMRVNRFLLEIIDRARRSLPITVYGDGSPTVDWVYVDDVVAGLLQAAEHHRSDVLNLGSGIGLSNLELAQLAVSALGSRSQIELDNTRQFTPRRQVLDLQRIRSTLGYEPEHSIESGLEKMSRHES